MARPTSLCAVANRVTESIIRITCLPQSRKYSAMAVAIKAPLILISGRWSEVATTTTDRFRPSSPRALSRKSFTSRPRSPIRAITFTSAVVLRAIIPRRTLFPTPDPEKMPILCPQPMVKTPLIALIPVSRGRLIRFLNRGFMGSV